MLFEFSSHRLEQIKLRSITKDVVELVINEPDEIIIEEDNQHVFQKIIENYLYRVFINTNKNPYVIKTVYRTSKITKYL
ncbi:DUF4258 domain-containing protein [Flavobacterium sp.]|jgi:hypothetical protein|uniref:DUF4258 domain-containing protein n=1 Tax=Flavobacterium sp. TaxID=239 RepID=UPI0037BE7907